MVDISGIKAEQKILEIKHPVTGENVGIRMTLLPMTDSKMKMLSRQIQDQRNKIIARGKIFDAEKTEEATIKLCSAAITGWEWYADADAGVEQATFRGEIPKFNAVNVIAVLTDSDWVRAQVDAELGEITNFFN